MQHRFRWAGVLATLWALLPLGYYLPDSASDKIGPAIEGLCMPAWFLAYVLLGGVHSGNFSLFPVLCSLLTWMMVFGVFAIATKSPPRERKVPDREPRSGP